MEKEEQPREVWFSFVGTAKEFQEAQMARRSDKVGKARGLEESRLDSKSSQAGSYFPIKKDGGD